MRGLRGNEGIFDNLIGFAGTNERNESERNRLTSIFGHDLTHFINEAVF